MPNRPTRDELLERIRALEAETAELRANQAALAAREARLRLAEQVALLGHWELDLVSGNLCWSDEIYRIFELDPAAFGATYEAFLETVHPDDRQFVNDSFTSSLTNHTGYDIVHRLQLRDGRVKYVNERCHTEYDPDGTPLRSLGTVQDITARMRRRSSFAGMIGRDARMQEVFETIRDLAAVDLPVLIQGESGTGKELVAAAIHREGPRATRPFVPVNCGALPEGLLESELFGHVRGAFTGALRDKKGRFELAAGGTLFLDEVADLPPPVQVKLLRVLQEGTFERVGGEATVAVDVRVISAANRDLKQEVDRGNFRADLFYRIRVVPIDLPPLRERQPDIPLLVDHFLEQGAREGRHAAGISRAAVAAMLDYRWPGNVRELHSAIYYAMIKSRGERIEPAHLPPELRSAAEARPPFVVPPGQRRSAPPPPEADASQRVHSRPLDAASVTAALDRAGGNKVKAARLLGVGRATLYRFLKKQPS